jgi:hypothetical protein
MYLFVVSLSIGFYFLLYGLATCYVPEKVGLVDNLIECFLLFICSVDEWHGLEPDRMNLDGSNFLIKYSSSNL